MSKTVSTIQRSSVMASLALNLVLILAIFLPVLPIKTNAAITRYCVLPLPLVASLDLAQSGKIRSNTVRSVVQLPVSNVRRSTFPKTAGPVETHVSFVRCKPRGPSLDG